MKSLGKIRVSRGSKGKSNRMNTTNNINPSGTSASTGTSIGGNSLFKKKFSSGAIHIMIIVNLLFLLGCSNRQPTIEDYKEFGLNKYNINVEYHLEVEDVALDGVKIEKGETYYLKKGSYILTYRLVGVEDEELQEYELFLNKKALDKQENILVIIDETGVTLKNYNLLDK